MNFNIKKIFEIYLINFLLNIQIQCCPIYLTISLDSIFTEESRLEINWGPNCIEKPEWIGIFKEDPSISTKPSIDCIRNITTLSGRYVTKVQLGKLYFPGGWERDAEEFQMSYSKGKCLPFYVASFAYNEDLIRVECLKIQPNWMRLSDPNIGKVPLKHLFIPGTHSSGAFNNVNYKNHSILVQTFGCSQNMDIWSQLVFGIRYLDLKIGYKEETNDFWIVNENMMITPLQPILEDVKYFVKISGEIVIIDFSSFPIGFYKQPERHVKLLKFILRELKDVTFRRSDSIDTSLSLYDLTMNDIRKENKNILITYRLEKLAKGTRECDLIWPSWKKFSIRSQNITNALDFMRVLFTQKDDLELTKNKGWIFEAIKTIEESLNSQKTIKSARNRANELNSKILNFIGGPWSLTANVVTLDFFSSTNLIDIAIYANSHKAFTYANNNLTKLDIRINYNY